jgi:NitT/TauT family transport system substrate-binding protein
MVRSKSHLNRPKWQRYGTLWLGYQAIVLALGLLGLELAEAQSLTKVSIRLDWLVDGSYAGEAVAVDKGFYREQGLDLTLNPGGANANPIQLTVGGSDLVGNAGSIPAIFLARSNGLPVKAVWTALQKHPFCWLVRKDSGINGPQDFVGKRVSIQATGRPLIDAVIAKYKLPRDKVTIVVSGEPRILRAGQVDAYGTWCTDFGAIEAAGGEAQIKQLLLWDMGIHLYAYPYFVTDDTLKKHPDVIAKVLAGSAKGWGWAADHPEEAVDSVLKYSKDLKRDFELRQLKLILPFVFTEATKEKGWGWMEPAVWQEAIDIYGTLGLMKNPVTPNDSMTQDILIRVPDRPKR